MYNEYYAEMVRTYPRPLTPEGGNRHPAIERQAR